MEKLSRKQREKLRKKFDIMEAAESAFALKGFHGATMAEISTVSEFPLATIYKLFGNKENIYFELLDIKAKKLICVLEELISRDDICPHEKLKGGVDASFLFYKDNRNFVRLYLQERQRLGTILPKDLKKQLRRTVNQFLNAFIKVFDEGMEKDVFKFYSSTDCAELFVGMINSAASNWLINGENDELFKEKLDTSLAIFIGGISRN